MFGLSAHKTFWRLLRRILFVLGMLSVLGGEKKTGCVNFSFDDGEFEDDMMSLI